MLWYKICEFVCRSFAEGTSSLSSSGHQAHTLNRDREVLDFAVAAFVASSPPNALALEKNTTISECVPNRQKLFLFFFLSFTCHFSLPYIFDLSTSWALLHHHHHHLLYHPTRLDDLICTALYSMQRTFVCCIWNRRQAIKDRLSMQGTTFQVHHF